MAFTALILLFGLLVSLASDRLKLRLWKKDLERNPFPDTWEDEQ